MLLWRCFATARIGQNGSHGFWWVDKFILSEVLATLRDERFMARLKSYVTLIKFQRYIKEWYVEKTFAPGGTFDRQCQEQYTGILGPAVC